MKLLIVLVKKASYFIDSKYFGDLASVNKEIYKRFQQFLTVMDSTTKATK